MVVSLLHAVIVNAQVARVFAAYVSFKAGESGTNQNKERNMRGRESPGLVVAILLAFAMLQSASAQTVEWSTSAKLSNGSCGEGVLAQVVERDGSMNIKSYLRGKQVSEVNIALNPDGSGKGTATGAAGRVIWEVPAGGGKRHLKTSQMDGACQWTWAPQ